VGVEMTSRADGEVPTRSMQSVSIRDIGDGDSDWSWGSGQTNIGELAKVREIDREFALRELVTSQKVATLWASGGNTWKNWLDDHETSDLQAAEPNTADGLREEIVGALRNDNSSRIRAVGAGHSHSRAAKPEEYFLELSTYNQGSLEGLIGDLPEKWQKSDYNKVDYFDPKGHDADLQTRRVGAGNTIKYLNREVLLREDQALLNMGSYDAQTLAGAVNTSTHGTGHELGTIADSVLSVEMLTVMESPAVDDTPVVRKFRIEPTNGITDRKAFEADVGDHGMTLIQDDEIFHSTVVGYGAMGVATAYTLKVREKFYLKETSEVRNWDDLKNDLDSYYNDNDVDQFQILLNTQSVHDPTTPNQKCLIKKWEEDSWQSNPPERDKKPPLQKVREDVTGGGVNPLSNNPLLATILTEIYFKNQQDGPQFQGYWETASFIALRRLRDTNHSDPRSPPSSPELGMSTEIAVPIDKVDEAMDHLIDNVIDSVQINGKKVRFSVPTGIRFAASSEHKFTAEYEHLDRPNGVALIEVPFSVAPVNDVSGKVTGIAAFLITKGIGPPAALALNPILGAALFSAFVGIVNSLLPSRNISQSEMLEISKKALDDIESGVVGQFDGRPHMGKFNTIGEQGKPGVDDLYPSGSIDVWQRVLKQFNAFGTFNNGFTEKLGLSVKRDSNGAYTPRERNNSP